MLLFVFTSNVSSLKPSGIHVGKGIFMPLASNFFLLLGFKPGKFCDQAIEAIAIKMKRRNCFFMPDVFVKLFY
jgi:hypothetical protein